jgi:DNA-binding PadR family transcriptional regulator
MPIDRFAKDLVAGTYDLIILEVLRGGPAYGYEIRRRVFERSTRTILWREGTLYHVLHHLEKQRLVTSSWRTPKTGRERRYYQLTPRGQRARKEHRRQWDVFTGAVNALLRSRQ